MADTKMSEFPSVTSVTGTDEIPCVQDGNKKLTPNQLATYLFSTPVVIRDSEEILPIYGSELLTTDGWTVGSGWSESPDDKFTHSSGVNTLTHSASIENETQYQILYTITGRTAGSINITFGGLETGSMISTGSWGPTTISTDGLVVIPTTDFNGTCSFSLKQITDDSSPQFIFKDIANESTLEIRSSYDYANTFIGAYSGNYNTTGMGNASIGTGALYYNTSGSDNTANGVYSLFYNTTGLFNTAIGANALYHNTYGSYNTANGYGTLFFNISGTRNTAVGLDALNANTIGSNNTALGCKAGRYHASGLAELESPENSVYIGYDARGKNNDDNNSIVIAGITGLGLGANTTVLGNSSTTLTRLFGDIATGTDTPSAAIHAIKTTEQLRLGYDANNYVAQTVDSSGNVLIDAVGVVKIGSSSNYAQIGTDGTITLVGTATAFDDLLIEMKESIKGSGTKPDWDATNLGFLFPQNDPSEIIYLNVQMPHRWKEGSTIYPHVHFFQSQNVTPTFKMDYRWVNIGDSVPSFTTGYTMNSIIGAQTWTSGLLHRVVTNVSGLSGSGKKFSSMLQIKLYRDDNTYSGDCLVVSFDIHYEIDSFGTSSEYTK